MHAHLDVWPCPQSPVVRLPLFAWDGQRWASAGRSRRPASRLRIDRWDRRGDGPFSAPAARDKLERLGYETRLCTHAPGSGAAGQISDRDRVDAVVSGLLKITVDGETTILGPGDSIRVPRGCLRRLQVAGSAPVVAIEAERA